MQYQRLREGSPFCDSDEEVFVGPVTSKELDKASKLKRRTQAYFPVFDWKQSLMSSKDTPGCTAINKDISELEDQYPHTSDLGMDKHQSVPNNASELNDKGALMDSAGNFELNSHLQSSSKSEDSLERCTSSSLNVAHIVSLNSDKSLERKSEGSQQTSDEKLDRELITVSDDSLNEKSELASQSDDSLENSLKDSLDLDNRLNKDTPFQMLVSHSNETEFIGTIYSNSQPDIQLCSIQLENGSVLSSQNSLNVAHINSTQSISSANSDSQNPRPAPVHSDVYINAIDTDPSQSYNTAVANSVVQTVEEHKINFLPTGINENVTNLYHGHFNAGHSHKASPPLSVPCGKDNLSEVVPVDKDGGYLSILSEAALYHASQGLQNISMDSGSGRSLEDRFDDFGVKEDDLEKQQLSESIMYTTGRDSFLCNNSSAYFPQKNVVGRENILSTVDEREQTSNILECDKGMGCSSEELIEIEETTTNAVSEDNHHETEKAAKDNYSGFLEQEDSEVRDNESTEMHTANSDFANSSYASSISERMNDTLEEYEMMMRYGVDYIMGNIKPKDIKTSESENLLVEMKQETDTLAQMSPSPKQKITTQKSPLPKVSTQKLGNIRDGHCRTPVSTPKKETPSYSNLMESPFAARSLTKTSSQKIPCSSIPRAKQHGCGGSRQLTTPSPKVAQKLIFNGTPGSSIQSSGFKKPVNPVSVSRLPKYGSSATTPKNNLSKSSQKVLGSIQSPVSAYIHNTASPVLVTNVKAKVKDVGCWENEMHARAVWRAGEKGSSIPKPSGIQPNIENVNPNVGCSLPSVKYTRAPCIKLGEPLTQHLPKISERVTKLLDTPCPQVIKHEGRVNINSGSPQLTAKVQAVARCPDDSMIGVGCAPGDISVCVTKTAARTDTLSLKSPSKIITRF